MAWRWFLDGLEHGRQWTESVTQKKSIFQHGPGNSSQAMPTGPTLPTVPTIDLGLGLQPIKWEENFFDYFTSLVARIKAHQNYSEADGDLLGIEGAERQPPSPAVVPALKVTTGPGGWPQLALPKGQFDGYDCQFKIGDGAGQTGPFVSTRRFVHQITLPAPGQAVVYNYCAQYRYQGQPFGQKSAWVNHTIHG